MHIHLHDELAGQVSPAPELLQHSSHHVRALGGLPGSHIQLGNSLGIDVGRGNCCREEGQGQGPCSIPLDGVDGLKGCDGAQAGAEEGVGLVLHAGFG